MTSPTATLAGAIISPDAAQDKKYKSIPVKTPDGLAIAAQEWGNPTGPEILFIHGISQSYLSWSRQVESDLAKDFRMVTYDLRGHGGSDKPFEPERYKESKAWGDEVQAVIDAAGLKRPVLVGWSYAGRVIGDYLKIHGAGRLAGLNYVDAISKKDDRALSAQAWSRSTQWLPTTWRPTSPPRRLFLHCCFEKQPTQDEFETMLGFNMMVPPKVRAAMLGRQLSMDDILKALKLPVLVTHGSADKIILLATGQYTAATIPNAKLSVYDGLGHSPFWEDTPRFNAELAAFVRTANGK